MEKQMFLKASGLIFENARKLRANPTHAEVLLWGYLKQSPLGFKFRRQHPIADYIADFYCHAFKLIVEVDGNIHAEPEIAINDESRQKYLEEKGIVFLRFTNTDVEKRFEIVKEKIEHFIINNPDRVHNMGKPL